MSIYNSRRAEHKTPFGAVKSGTKVTFRIFKSDAQTATLAVFKDGSIRPVLISMNRNGEIFEADYLFAEAGLYFYMFVLPNHTQVVRGDFGEGVLTEMRSHPSLFQQTVFDAEYRPASRFCGGAMYQIFPDRFNIGKCGVLSSPYGDRTFHTDLSDLPSYLPDETGEVKNHDYFGGNLRGIEEKLDYLKQLGIDCIYLNPIGEAHSNHRYDTADYKKADPVLGTEKDFKKLCSSAHRRGIKIVLDGVFSHTGADSVYFNKLGRYDSVGAYQSRDSKYASWYKFSRFPDEYASWWGFKTLPEVNEEDENFSDFICGKGGVIDYWIKLGADGFRLDVADELPDGFIEKIRSGVKRNGSDKILIGEVWEDASNKISYGRRRRFLWGTELDSTMNYPFRTAILNFVKTADAMGFMSSVTEICENYPKEMLDQMMNMLSTHDTERAINALSCGDESMTHTKEWLANRRLGTDEYLRGVEMLKLCFVLQFTLPGIPCVYYGDEIGMQGFGDPFCRGFMRWDSMDLNVRGCLEKISAFRRENRAIFADGELHPIKNDGGVVAYLRKSRGNGEVFVAVNRSEEIASVAAPNGKTVVMAPWSYILKKL
ncbi:MAG: glycoside hydrolase family 13 protein [Oscillospiraceae bacterium]